MGGGASDVLGAGCMVGLIVRLAGRIASTLWWDGEPDR
jgi:hypothetical protein